MRARDAGPGARGLERPEPRRSASAAGGRRARRLVVPGHRRHLPQRPAASWPHRRPAPPRRGRRRLAGRRGPARRPTCRPGITGSSIAAPSRRAIAPIWSWSTTSRSSASDTVIKDGQGRGPRRPVRRLTGPRRGSSVRTRSTWRRSTNRRSACRWRRRPVRSSRSSPTRSSPGARRASVRRLDGHWAFDPERDVLLIASIERHRASGRIGLGLVSGFGLTRDGALGLVGRARFAQPDHRRDQPPRHARVRPGPGRARRRLRRRRGGPRAGDPAAARRRACSRSTTPIMVCRQLDEVNRAAHALGCPLDAPFGTLSFLALPVIPELRITDPGRLRRPRTAVSHALNQRRISEQFRSLTWRMPEMEASSSRSGPGADCDTCPSRRRSPTPIHVNPDLAPTTLAQRRWGVEGHRGACGSRCRPAFRPTCSPRR